MATDAKKVNLFQVIASAEISERIPRVPGAYHFALPFVGDADVTWADYLVDQIEPRAIPIGRYPADHATKPGQVYPLNVTTILEGVAAAAAYDTADPGDQPALQEQIDAGLAEQAAFLGVLIDGFDYTKDLNITVTLAAGIPLKFLQGTPAAPSQTVDDDIVAVADLLGLKIFNGQVFWNKVQ